MSSRKFRRKSNRSAVTAEPNLFSATFDIVNQSVNGLLDVFRNPSATPPKKVPQLTPKPPTKRNPRTKFDERILNSGGAKIATGLSTPNVAPEVLTSEFMHPQDAAKMARELMTRHGVGDWTFGFNRGKRTMGLCRYKEKRIELSYHFVVRNIASEVMDVILHEIAHALAGHAAGHGPKWQARCREIGARPERCGKAEMPVGRWSAKCTACTQLYTRHRRPLRGRTYSCGKCGPVQGPLEFRVIPV